MLWLISEADRKHSTRYRSCEVIRLARDHPNSEMRIHHEHVYPRARVANKILSEREGFISDQSRLFALLDQTVGCIVTVCEHARLNKKAEGWERYTKVPVFDMSTSLPTLWQTCVS